MVEVVLKRGEFAIESGLANATATGDERETEQVYFNLLGWGSAAVAVVLFGCAFAGVRECRYVQRTGRPWYDRLDVREVEGTSTLNVFGLENRDPDFEPVARGVAGLFGSLSAPAEPQPRAGGPEQYVR